MIRVSAAPAWTIGDLFVALRDELRPVAAPLLARIDRHQLVPALAPGFARLVDEARTHDGAIPPGLREELRGAIAAERALEIVLAIDEAFETFARGDDGWAATRRALASPPGGGSSTLAPHFRGMVLLPGWRSSVERPERPHVGGKGELRSLLNWLHEATPDYTVRWRALSPDEDLAIDAHTIRIGVVPLMNGQDAVFGRSTVNGTPFFHVKHAPAANGGAGAEQQVFARLREAIIRCAQDDVDVLFAPELVCTEEVWRRVEAFLASIPVSVVDSLAPKPRWLILGTAMVDVDEGGEGFNRSRVLIRPSAGRSLWEQDKINPYAISYEERERYGLLGPIGSDERHIRELARPGIAGLWLLDSAVLGRVAITICEDLGRSPAQVACALGASVLFAPVMDGPLRYPRWAVRHAGDLHHAGCRVIVANSLVLSHLANRQDAARWPAPYEFGLCGDFVLAGQHDRSVLSADDASRLPSSWSFDLVRRT
jgi:predicted amidohydrolase